jgi:UDP-N-acetylmuramyl pentapeptide synthase
LVYNLLCFWPWDQYAVLEAGISKPNMMGANSYLLKPNIVVVTSIKWAGR